MALIKSFFRNSLYGNLHALRRRFYQMKFRLWYAFVLKNSGKSNVIFKPIFITPEFITLGDSVVIGYHSRIEGVGKYEGVSYSPQIIIDSNVTIEQNVHITFANSITIGRDTAIAANVTITDIDHPYTDIYTPPEKQPIKVDSVVIGSSCKIYNNVVILPGVRLGKHNVVGANSVVVAGQYPDYCVIAGSPARVIKRFDTTAKRWIKE